MSPVLFVFFFLWKWLEISMNRKFMEQFEDCPVIAAVKDEEDPNAFL